VLFAVLTNQDTRSLHQGHDVEQDDKCDKRERNRDRTGAARTLLRFREHDAFILPVIHRDTDSHEANRASSPPHPRSANRTANNTNR
jgi:hypothetical protein